MARRGDPEGALQAYIRVLEIRERLAAADPNNTQYQRDLFEILITLGNRRRADGDAADALQAYTRSLPIAQGLADANPDNPQYRRYLGISAHNAALVLDAAGDASAIDYWIKARQAFETLDAAGKLADSDRQFLELTNNKLGLKPRCKLRRRAGDIYRQTSDGAARTAFENLTDQLGPD